MNSILLRRLFWKEFRAQRGLWLGVMAIGFVVQLLVWAMMPPNQRQPQATLMSIGLILSAFYAVGCAAVMFAGEREERTDTWLRNLPVGSLTVFFSKLAWMLSSWIVSAVMSLLVALVLVPGRENITLNSESVPDLLSYGALLPLWGILFSLICRRVHLALGGAAVMLVVTMGINSYFPGAAVVVVLCLTAANLGFARDWLLIGEESQQSLAISPRAYTLDKALASSTEASPTWRSFRRELWLEWRHARWWAVGYACVAFVVMLLGALSEFPDWPQTCWFVVFAVTPLCFGASVFRAELYRERYRFQANRGVTPSAMWLSKQIVWLGLLLVTQLILSVFFLPVIERTIRTNHAGSFLWELLPVSSDFLPYFLIERMEAASGPFLAITAGVTSLLYCIGCVCSRFSAQSVTSLAVALVAGTVSLFWVLAAVVLDVPFVISIGMPCLLLTLFSFGRMPGWLAERTTVRDQWKLTAIAILLVMCVLSTWVVFRVSEVDLPRPVAGAFALFPAPVMVGTLLTIGILLAPLATLLGIVIAVGVIRWRRVLLKKLPVTSFRSLLACYGGLHILAACGFAAFWGAPEVAAIDDRLPKVIADLEPTVAALETAEAYKRADELLTGPFPQYQDGEGQQSWTLSFRNWDDLTDEQKQWAADNEESFTRVLAVTQRDQCAAANLFRSQDSGQSNSLDFDARRSFLLLRLKALQAESTGDLAEAWSLHRAALRMIVHHTQGATPATRRNNIVAVAHILFDQDFPRWLDRPGQTPELLDRAAQELATELQRLPSLASAFDLQATYATWAIRGNNLPWRFDGQNTMRNWQNGMYLLLHRAPWERTRAVRVVGGSTQHAHQLVQAFETGDPGAFIWRFQELESEWGPYLYRRYPVLANYGFNSTAQLRIIELEESTPVCQAAMIGGLSPFYHESLASSTYTLLGELDFISSRRLCFLRLASRKHALVTGEAPADLDTLALSEAALPILESGEQLETGNPVQPEGEDIPARRWRVMLNPTTGHAFERDQILARRAP